MYSTPQLRSTFEALRKSSVDGIPGVMRIDGRERGTTLGITVCTHGNEPSGLAAVRYLLETVKIRRRLKRGTLYLVLNNIGAAGRYFSDKEAGIDRPRTRLIDVNMNRLPKDLLKLRSGSEYEVQRARKLYPIWRRFQVGFDIHSTTKEMVPTIIMGGKTFDPDLFRGFPASVVLSNIDNRQIGWPAFRFYGPKSKGVPVFEIEAGSHESPDSFRVAATCAEALLQTLKMIPGRPKQLVSEYREYLIDGSIIFPNDSYRLKKSYDNFTLLSKGTVVATGTRNGKTDVIRTPFDCHVFFCSGAKQPSSIAEEVMFLSRPVRSIRVES